MKTVTKGASGYPIWIQHRQHNGKNMLLETKISNKIDHVKILIRQK